MSNEPIPTVPLNNGVAIPQLGFGTFKIPPEQTRDVVTTALEVGYRHIDTAQMYRNERGVGEALAASGLARDDLFVTTKLNNAFHAHDDALAAFDQSLEELGLEHVDLFLIHWPLPAVDKYVEAWGALEEIYRSGRARAIGVSNFQPNHLRRLMDSTTVVPAVNQIEVHPWLGNEDVRAVNAEHGIVTEAWSPLGRGRLLEDPTIMRIAENVGKTPAQVVLRWHVQRGDVVFPKSVTPARIEENFRIFDVELSEADVADITALDRGERTGSHPDEMNNTGR
ncbi:aldo/keto reductase [Isoptericola halotolerans]|uniref:2,5-diketo-D-gluconate reductase A n=1 Tax=Isoptericola halotolerans TaxID=300560 RepID=A0ABX2A201_9MICO|nr:aldo/keto reductase [Isoptericola halotolerans]NOV95777.1 2,5-diketo-D-gluconate reductase A [Isoptericola halotolerans]